MSRKKFPAQTPTISLAALARCAGIPVSTLYAREGARGAIPLTQGIQYLEGELALLYQDKPRSRRIRALEDGLRELRVQRALHRIQNRPKRQRRTVVFGRKPEPVQEALA
jgi:hypothetical protein